MESLVEWIVKKRDGAELSATEIAGFVEKALDSKTPDYQLAAFLMAVYFRGLSDAETVALTRAMLHSGRVLQLKSVRGPTVDKHSTGGVGDKISLCLGPLVAACGVFVPMISGRGLGHTGGTLDKLEAIPGYRVTLDAREFERVVREVGVSIIGQTSELAPADRRLYALRDVTGTVESIPLIVASILSKKLASGIGGLVLDVKSGRGAFMKDEASAKELARALVRVGTGAGIGVVALVTDMSAPIGLTVGNALETREAIEVLRGAGPPDTRELTLTLGVEMLLVAGVAARASDARKTLERALADGSALARFAQMVHAHGGKVRCVEKPELLPKARHVVPVFAARSGTVTGIDPLALGLASVGLGAGRTRADQKVDPAAGIQIAAPLGAQVKRGDPLAFLHARKESLAEAERDRVASAFSVGRAARSAGKRVIERLAPKQKRRPRGDD